MPFPKKRGKKQAAKNISEFHTGKTYARTKRKFGKATADKQAVAAGMRAAGMPMRSMRSPMAMRGEGEMMAYAKKRKK